MRQERLIQERPVEFVDYIPKLKDTLDYLAFLSPDSAAALLHALQPLIAIRPSFKDYVIVVHISYYTRTYGNIIVCLVNRCYEKQCFVARLKHG